MVDEVGEAGEAFAAGGGQAAEDGDGRGVGGRDADGDTVGADVANGVDEDFEILAVAGQEGVHGFHPWLLAAEAGHVGERLESFGDEGQATLSAGTRMICWCG